MHVRRFHNALKMFSQYCPELELLVHQFITLGIDWTWGNPRRTLHMSLFERIWRGSLRKQHWWLCRQQMRKRWHLYRPCEWIVFVISLIEAILTSIPSPSFNIFSCILNRLPTLFTCNSGSQVSLVADTVVAPVFYQFCFIFFHLDICLRELPLFVHSLPSSSFHVTPWRNAFCKR